MYDLNYISMEQLQPVATYCIVLLCSHLTECAVAPAGCRMKPSLRSRVSVILTLQPTCQPPWPQPSPRDTLHTLFTALFPAPSHRTGLSQGGSRGPPLGNCSHPLSHLPPDCLSFVFPWHWFASVF